MKVGDKVVCTQHFDSRFKVGEIYTIVEMRIRNHNIMKDGNIKILESAYIEGECRKFGLYSYSFKQDFIFEKAWTGDLCFHEFFISLKDQRKLKLEKINESR